MASNDEEVDIWLKELHLLTNFHPYNRSYEDLGSKDLKKNISSLCTPYQDNESQQSVRINSIGRGKQRSMNNDDGLIQRQIRDALGTGHRNDKYSASGFKTSTQAFNSTDEKRVKQSDMPGNLSSSSSEINDSKIDNKLLRPKGRGRGRMPTSIVNKDIHKSGRSLFSYNRVGEWKNHDAVHSNSGKASSSEIDLHFEKSDLKHCTSVLGEDSCSKEGSEVNLSLGGSYGCFKDRRGLIEVEKVTWAPLDDSLCSDD